MWKKVIALLMATAASRAADLPTGQIVDSVECALDATQHYALYLPSNYTPSRQWSVILAFDPQARGGVPVERYQQAAEKYGYIVAGSLNSRNGPWDVSLQAAKAMTADVKARFSIDPKRVYTAGMSGGARVAMKIAIDSRQIAGVFASSAGFPDEFIARVPFAVFGSAGTDDFNHLEMYQLDRRMTSAHRVLYFEGGHTWLPAELAMQGVEWMELQAMKSGLRPPDTALLDRWFAARVERIDALQDNAETLHTLIHLVADFEGLEDVSKYAARAARLLKQQDVRDALREESKNEERELRVQSELFELRDSWYNGASFAKLKERVTALLAQSKAADDSEDRRIARRVLSNFAASSRSTRDPQYQELLDAIRRPAPGR
jgi:poly(3-hydroxybutyrate) depolymerase